MAYAPTIGGRVGAPFPLQFPRASIDRNSLAVVLIEHLSNDGLNQVVSHGTGFMWRHETKIWLVSARHVLSGRDPFDDSLVSPHGYIPQSVRVHPSIADPLNAHRYSTVVHLLDKAGTRLWLQDPQFANLRTDIAAISIDVDMRTCCINDDADFLSPASQDLFSHIGLECSVIGYPNRNVSGLMVPIWRRGSLASEPLLPIDGKPIFLVDAATSPGLSGSPVLRRHYGPAPYHNSSGGINIQADAVVRTQFIGVYVGRVAHSHFGGEIPFAFYGNRVPLVIAHGT